MKKGGASQQDQLARCAPPVLWMEVHCDLIEQWEHKVGGLKVKVCAIAMIDPAANLVKISRVESAKSKENSCAFVGTWSSWQQPLEWAIFLVFELLT